jgi:ABC-type multidrug transport system ATPase subunit
VGVHSEVGRPGLGVEVAAVGLVKTVGAGKRVLNDVSVTVWPGELVGVAGGIGAGKTMLLEALAGVRRPEQGEVRFDGVDLYANLFESVNSRMSPFAGNAT